MRVAAAGISTGSYRLQINRAPFAAVVVLIAGAWLAKGEKVVVRGALRIAPGVKVNIIDSAAAS